MTTPPSTCVFCSRGVRRYQKDGRGPFLHRDEKNYEYVCDVTEVPPRLMTRKKSNEGPSWATPKPYHPGSRQHEAAKWLRIASNRFLQGKDSAQQVTNACAEWFQSMQAANGDVRLPAEGTGT